MVESQIIIEQEDFRYTVYKNPDLTIEISISKPIALGVEVYHILTEKETSNYFQFGISSLENRMKDMNENFSNYRVVSWR